MQTFLLVTVSLLLPNLLLPTLTGATTRAYTISSSGVCVGAIQTTRTTNGNAQTSEILTSLDLNPLGVDYFFINQARVQWNNRQLSSFDHWIVAKEDRWHLSGRSMGSELLVAAAKVRTKEQQDTEDVLELSQIIASYTIPHAGTVSQVLALFLDEESEGEQSVPQSQFDTTDLQLHQYLLQSSPWQGEKTITTFFTDRLELEQIQVRYQGQQSLTIKNTHYQCSVFQIIEQEAQSTVWIAQQPEHNALLVQEKYKEDGLEFLTRLE
jgi:hypothetical protein